MNNRLMVSSVITLQLLAATTPAYSASLAEETNTPPVFSAENVAGTASGIAASAQHGNLSNTLTTKATSQATGMAETAVGDWLRQFGTAQVQLSVDEHGDWSQSSVDWLVPLWQTPENILFTQLGFRAPDGRNTANIGIGVRTFSGNWMYGTNVFFDNDYTGNNRRVGIGAEAWRDYLKLSANTYFSMTDWHQSRDFADYDERPADGWDIRAEAYLPAWPQLGGKLVYEKYHGDSVALMDSDTREKNPEAITFGVNYTPIPLITAGVDVKSSHETTDTQIALTLNYVPGESWQKQISPDAVTSVRSLAGNKLDLVNRNNTIVLDYRKQELISLNFPVQIQGAELTPYTFTPDTRSKYAVSRIELDDTSLVKAGGKVISVAAGSISIQLPAFTGQNPVTLRGVAVDVNGNRSNMAETSIVTSSVKHIMSLASDKTTLTADGLEKATLTVSIHDTAGNALSGEQVTLRTEGGTLSASEGRTDVNGQLTITLTSLVAGTFRVTATNGTQTTTSSAITFTEQSSSLTLAPEKNTAIADGTDRVIHTLTVKNADGTPAAGKRVAWSTSAGTLTDMDGTTDGNGQARASLTSQKEGAAVVTASVNGESIKSESVMFSLVLTLNVAVDKNTASANGTDSAQYTLTVTDSAGHPVPNKTVNWSTSLGELSATTTVTDVKGQSIVKLASKKSGVASVKAEVEKVASSAPDVTFNAEVAEVTAVAVDANGGNKNNIAFGTRSPDYAWGGAKIRLSMKGATGNVTWSASSASLSINGDIITIDSKPGKTTITGVDEGGKTGEWTLNISHWIPYISTEKMPYGATNYVGSAVYECAKYNATVMSKGVMTAVHGEWGDFAAYSQWTRNYYQTSTPYSGTDPKLSNWAFWPETGEWMENKWTQLVFACE